MSPLLAAQREAALALLPPAVVDYYAGGSGEETSLAEAEQAWRDVRLRPRVLRDVADVDTAVTLLGTALRTPVLAAPSAHHGLAHPDGERATAAGVRAAGSLMVLSTRSTVALEEVGADPWWLQVYVVRDRARTVELVQRAAAAGASALVLTGDTPYVSTKARRVELPQVPQPRELQQDPALTPDDIGWLAGVSGLPVLVKGVLRGDDAARCLDAGAAGVVVSNHGGRQLDRAVPTARALPEVADAVAGRAPVLVDGGIRSGLDVLCALALGADAVLLGRPVLWALAAGGADGVAGCLDTVTAQLAEVLALAGCACPAAADRSLVAPA